MHSLGPPDLTHGKGIWWLWIGMEQERWWAARQGAHALPRPSNHANVFHGVEDHWVGKWQLQKQHQPPQTHGILAGMVRLILSALISWLSSLQCETLPGRVLGQQRGSCVFWQIPKVTGTNWGDKRASVPWAWTSVTVTVWAGCSSNDGKETLPLNAYWETSEKLS